MSELNQFMLNASNERIRLERRSKSNPATADDIIDYIRKNGIPPIVARDVQDGDQFQLFNNIQPVEARIAGLDNKYQVFYGELLDSKLMIQGKEYPIYFRVGSASYSRADRITDFYQEEERIKSYSTNRKLKDHNLSVYNLWYDEQYTSILRDIINSSLTHCRDNYWKDDKNQPITAQSCYNNPYFKRNLMSGLYFQGIYTSQYRVTWVVSIIQFFQQFVRIESMLDPFAGWGDRLIGAMKMNINYQGYDPNSALHLGYKRMIQDLSGGDGSKYSVELIGFEDAIIDRQFDLVLTSPPYGPVEIYCDEPTQSIIKFKDNWLDGFYFPSLFKAWAALRIGGLFILHICDTRTFTLVKSTMKFFDSIKDCEHLGQFMAYTNKSNYPNLHLVYQKLSI